MSFDELNSEQRMELKQRILTERNMRDGEGTALMDLASADELVTDEDARNYAEGIKFLEDDFTCSAVQVFHVRVSWSVHKTFQVPAASAEEALAQMQRLVDAGEVSCWDSGWEADDGDDEPKIEIEDT